MNYRLTITNTLHDSLWGISDLVNDLDKPLEECQSKIFDLLMEDYLAAIDGASFEIVEDDRRDDLQAQNEQLLAQLARLEEMEYALDAGNTERSKIDPEALRVWLHYVHTGERDMPGIGYLVTLEASE